MDTLKIIAFAIICGVISYFRVVIIGWVFAARKYYQQWRRYTIIRQQSEFIDTSYCACALAQTDQGCIDATSIYNFLIDYNMLSSTQLRMCIANVHHVHIWFKSPRDKISATIDIEGGSMTIYFNGSTSVVCEC
jgi:hypothetical protein